MIHDRLQLDEAQITYHHPLTNVSLEVGPSKYYPSFFLGLEKGGGSSRFIVFLDDICLQSYDFL